MDTKHWQRLCALLLMTLVAWGTSACEEVLGGDDACTEGGACEPGEGSCGFDGPACESVVSCCDFINASEPQSAAAGACSLDRAVADNLAQSGAESDPTCSQILDKSVYEGICTSCSQ